MIIGESMSDTSIQTQSEYETKSKTVPQITVQDPRLLHFATSLKDDLSKHIQNISDKMQFKALELTQKPYLPQADIFNQEVQEYKAAFNQFIRTGNENAIKEMQHKALTIAGTGVEGGVLVSPQLNEKIIATIKNSSPMRGVCKTVTVTSNIADFIVDPYFSGAGWAAETDARLESATSSFQKVSVPVHEIYALPKASQRILDDSAFNVEEWIAERVAEKFIALENEAFTKGDGISKPSGILLKTVVASDAWTWNKIGVVKTGAADNFSTTNPIDCLLDLIYALKSGYRTNAVFMMNSKTLTRIRKFKDTNGRYLINENIMSNHELMLFGYRIVLNEDMDDVVANKLPILFGDFSRGYVIIDSYDIRILRDPYSAKPHVYFYITKRVGGDVLDYDAIKALKVGV
jgi:HK97 family phage major capsid protein